MNAPAAWSDSLTGLASILSELAASAVEKVLSERGLGFGTFDLLATVRAAEGKESQAQVAARLGIAPSSLTEAVAAAVRKGLVDQLQSSSNRRTRRLMLTADGDALLERCLASLSDVEQALRTALGDAELDRAAKTLRKANQVLLEALPNAQPVS